MPTRSSHPTRIVSVTAAGPASYANGGSGIALTGVRNILSCLGVYSSSTARVYHVRGITAPQTVTVVAMTLVNGAASTQVANGTDLSGDTLTFILECAE